MRLMTESDHMSPAPAVRCSSCEFKWNSPAMAEGLRLLGSCPKCSGDLVFAGDADAAQPAAAPEDRFAPSRAKAPHLVLGIPRR
jgi:hypothetical protein